MLREQRIMDRIVEMAIKKHPRFADRRIGFIDGYYQAQGDIISIIESRLSELLGDAQPTPILRYELQDLIKKINDEH